MDTLLISIGLLFNLLLISVFILRKYQHWAIIKVIGILLTLLGIPAIIVIILLIVQDGEKNIQTIIFLCFFLAYLIIEALFDLILKLEWRQNWKLMIPYLIFYYAANYSVVGMVWHRNNIWGPIIAALAVIQIVVNIWSHPRIKKSATKEN